jgi:acyl-CoA synthetase (AMP-forming)/AMP-acid ligase II
MFHMSAILPLLAATWSGATYITDTRFDAATALPQILAEQPTILFTAFPAIMAGILNHPDFDARRLARLRLVNNVAPPERLKLNMRALPQAVHVSAYGLTEASGVSCHGSAEEDEETRATGCGKPFDGVQMRVVDPATGAELPAAQRGEMQIRGYALFEGYYKAPERNAEAFTPDGWFRTGDLCAIDVNGVVSFHGRLKDVLKVGGENVAAMEVEAFLAAHPAVQLAQVVGVPDERLQEVVAAFIELRPGTHASAEEIIAYCRGRIASFKIPRHVRFVSEWPMSATKVQKFVLRERLVAELAST